MLSLLDKDVIQDHSFELLLLLVMSIGLIISLFTKKSSSNLRELYIENEFIYIDTHIRIPIAALTIHEFTDKTNLSKYLISDDGDRLCIYTYLTDDLIQSLLELGVNHRNYQIHSYSFDKEGLISMKLNSDNWFQLDLNTGLFQIHPFHAEKQQAKYFLDTPKFSRI
ncbi:hypothetical protein EP331_12340 [bacterium]|nr:MAG: hypothetical protein EP331_12340 [bacterium]